MQQCVKFILFWNVNLHVSDGFPVHHQEFKTVHTATGIFKQMLLCGCCMYSLGHLTMEGKTVRNTYSVILVINQPNAKILVL